MGSLAAVRSAALALALAAAAAIASPAPAVASDDCPGMSSYSYDGVTCSDTTGSTSQTMIDMYHASDRMQQRALDRSMGRVGGGGSGYAPAIRRFPSVSAETYARGYRAMQFTRGSSAPALRAIAAQITVAPAQRARAAAAERELLRSWYADAHRSGFSPTNVESAHLFFLESVFHARDGTWQGDRSTPVLVQTFLTRSAIVSGSPLFSASNAAKQQVADVLAFRGMLFLEMSAAMTSPAQHARLARMASTALRNDLGGDASGYTIDTLPCALAPHAASTPCDALLATLRSGG